MKQVCLVLVAVGISIASYGQFATLGPKIGINHSTLTEKDAQAIAGGDAAVGFHAGLFARFSVLGFYIQPEAMFTSSGGEIVIDGDDVNTNVDQVKSMRYNKIDVPVMLGFKIGPLLRLNAGPSFSFLLDSDIRDGNAQQQIEENYSNATVGFQAGIGIDISKINFDLRYENNLSALGDEVRFGGNSYSTDLRNQLWILTVGYELF
jgi:hypothetical protein